MGDAERPQPDTPELSPEQERAYEALRATVGDVFSRWADFTERAHRHHEMVLARCLHLITDDGTTYDLTRREPDLGDAVADRFDLATFTIEQNARRSKWTKFVDRDGVTRAITEDRDRAHATGTWPGPYAPLAEYLLELDDQLANADLEAAMGLNNLPAEPTTIRAVVADLERAFPDVEYYDRKINHGEFDTILDDPLLDSLADYLDQEAEDGDSPEA